MLELQSIRRSGRRVHQAPRSAGQMAMATARGRLGSSRAWRARGCGPCAIRIRTGRPAGIQHATRLTNETGFSEWPTWSPDGKLFAFSSNRDGNFEIYVRRVEAREDVNVTNNPADDVQPAFSPDGMSIAFVSTRSSRTGLIKIGTFIGFDTRTYGGDIWLTPALGGQARRLAEDGNFPVWHPNGRAAAVCHGTREPAGDSSRCQSMEGSRRRSFPRRRPGGKSFALDIRRTLVGSRLRPPIEKCSSCRRAEALQYLLFRGSSHVWDPSGRRIYYVNQEAGGGTRLETAELDLQEDRLVTSVARHRRSSARAR